MWPNQPSSFILIERRRIIILLLVVEACFCCELELKLFLVNLHFTDKINKVMSELELSDSAPSWTNIVMNVVLTAAVNFSVEPRGQKDVRSRVINYVHLFK